MSKRWTKEQDKLLKQKYAKTPKEELLRLLPNRSWNAIKNRANTTLKVKRRDLEILTTQELMGITETKGRQLRKRYNLNKREFKDKLDIYYNNWWLKEIYKAMLDNDLNIFEMLK